jgi:DedD protein
VASQVQDDGFHEIQLNGKQLVFLFMAATVVSVVIFLCGVLVGRGVRTERAGSGDLSSVTEIAETTPHQPAAIPPPTPAGSDPTVAAPPPPAADDLTYFNRLEKSKPATEELKPSPAPVPAKVPARESHAAGNSSAAPASNAGSAVDRRSSATEAQRPAANDRHRSPSEVPRPVPSGGTSTAEPSGQGYAVQIAALNVRTEAEAIAKRLSSKGYAAYVVAPATGTPPVYRVRVGKFPTRREAESVAARLQKEEQFTPWVTR